MLAKCASGSVSSVIMLGFCFVKFIMYKVVVGHLHPSIIVSPVLLLLMSTFPLSNVAAHPWSQKVYIDRSAVRRLGKMWASLAAGRKFLLFRRAVCVE